MTKHRIVMLAAVALLLAVVVTTGCRSAHTTSAILYIEQEQYQKAIDVIDEGLQYNPDDPEGFYFQGEAYSRMAQQAIDENDFPGAKSSFKEAYAKYSLARDMAPDNVELADRVSEALEINYRNTLLEGKPMWKDTQYQEAEGFFRLAFAALPDSLDSVRNLASMKIQMAEGVGGESPEAAAELREGALILLDQVLAENPEAYRLRADKAYVMTQLDRTAEAQAIYEQLLITHGDDPELLLDVIGLYTKQRRYEESGELFLQVADIYLNDTDPANDDQLKGLYSEAGVNFQTASDYPRALEAYSLASEQDVNDTQIMSFRVQMHLQYGQQKLLEAGNIFADDATRSGQLEAEGKATLQRGVEVGNALVAMAPNDAYAFRYLAQIQALLGDVAASTQNMQTYEELSGTQ